MWRRIAVTVVTLMLVAGCGNDAPTDRSSPPVSAPLTGPSINDVGELDLFSHDLCKDSRSLQPGGTFKVAGFNYLAHKTVEISWTSVEDATLHGELGSFTSDRNGHLAASVRFPKTPQGLIIEVIAVGPTPRGYSTSSEFAKVGAC
jgi:hypothetical protein